MHFVRTTIVHTGDGCPGLKEAMDKHFAVRCARGSIGGLFCDVRSVMYKYVRIVGVTACVEEHELAITERFLVHLIG